MDGRDCFDRFDFHDYEVFDENVQPESEVKANAVVDHGKRQLHRGVKSSLVEIMYQTSQIHTFQKSRSQGAVNFHGAIHDSAADLIEVHFCVLSVHCGYICLMRRGSVTIVTVITQMHVQNAPCVLRVLCG